MAHVTRGKVSVALDTGRLRDVLIPSEKMLATGGLAL